MEDDKFKYSCAYYPYRVEYTVGSFNQEKEMTILARDANHAIEIFLSKAKYVSHDPRPIKASLIWN